MYLIRLDDASEYMDIRKWSRIEAILEKYEIEPIVGIIPNNKDEDLVSVYEKNLYFWDKVKGWKSKQWTIALHGYNHVYITKEGGVNPINGKSEFAGVDCEVQKQKIRDGIKIFKSKDVNAKIFFAPAHTFDINTLEALRCESDIRIISDTIANDIYKKDDFYFIPQQSGRVRKLPFKVTTFCYHPNDMSEHDFKVLEDFIKKNRHKFINFCDLKFHDKKLSLYSKVLRIFYFSFRKIRRRFLNFN